MLHLAEKIYLRLMERRRRHWTAAGATRFAECQVISVGNLTTGGTGKTPTVQWIARHLQAENRKVAVVARGYGGTLSVQGAVVSDGRAILLDAHAAGDEPLLHARSLPGVPVVIGRDRVAAVQRAVRDFAPDVVVLDDAFQFWSLARDLDLVLLDARRPFDNGHLLPRGRLREPPAALSRASAVLLTRTDAASAEQRQAARESIARYSDAPVFEASHAPVALRDERDGSQCALQALQGARVYAVSALADNAGFGVTLRGCGADVVHHLPRRDHYRWREAEVQRVLEAARRAGAIVVTTEKDAVKWQQGWLQAEQAPPVWSLRIALKLMPDDDAFGRFLSERLAVQDGA
jgi:tetraacyldisaccharide 4'-kinase